MSYKQHIINILILMFATSTLLANTNAKFGKVDKTSLESTNCPIDKEADAYYILDQTEVSTVYAEKYSHRTKRHYQIKILSTEAAEQYKTIEIPIFKEEERITERLTGVKANVYNLVDGKIKKKKISNANIVRTHTSYHWEIATLNLPKVSVGSVIEVEYLIASNFYSYQNKWQYQHEIPSLTSTFVIEVPEDFKYSQYVRGNVEYSLDQYYTSGTFESEVALIDYEGNGYSYTASNIPSVEVNKTGSTNNNAAMIEYEVLYLGPTSRTYQDYDKTWPQVAEKLRNLEAFNIKQANYLNTQGETIAKEDKSDYDKMTMALEQIKSQTEWNGINSVFVSQGVKKTMETGSGNAADINLSLVTLLRKAGLEANPVVLSTRDNGILFEHLADAKKLNYTLASCTIDGQTYLMDATEDDLAVGQLPERCMNGRGILIKNKSNMWVALKSN